MTRRIDSVAIVIPARDEESLLPRCLNALGGAIDELTRRRPSIAVHTVVVAVAAWRTASTWLVSTDADSIVPHDWLVQHLDHAEQGADAVVGTVTPEFDGLSAGQIEAWTVSHPAGDPNGHVHGANRGIRADVYLAVDGFHPRAVGEDVELVARIASRGYRVIPSGKLDVMISSRAIARAPGGYASWLHEGDLIPIDRFTDPS